nr:ribonuclease H-like domain-containing protein [Tanacetum cinerariifolium]
KGKIKTGKLDFDDVYFVKELKFNLFSILQMCDKKNSVLFTDTECVVLSSDFKLPGENHVLLRVSREKNMYNVDLKNIVPSRDLTCLFAKATLDESNFLHRKLGHINFKIMNKLVKGNQSNGNAGTKSCDDAGKAKVETVPDKDYILLPLWTADLPFPQEPKSQEEEDSVNLTNRVNAVSSTVNAASNEFNVVGRKSSIELPDDLNMPELEDISIFEDSNEDVFGAEAELNNLESIFYVSPIPITKIYKDHPLEQVIGDLHSAPQTKRMNKMDERGIVIRNKARLVAQGHTKEEGIDYDEVFIPVARIVAIRLFLAYASFKDFVVYQMDVKSAFLYEKIEEKLVKQGLVKGFPKLKYTKDHLCSTCQMGKSKKKSYLPKHVPSKNEKLQMLHMDPCGPIWVVSINGKRYILVIVNDHSRFTWVKLLRTKDEALEIIIKFLKQAQVCLKATTEDLNTYDSDYDDILNAKSVLMANISNYGSDVISEVPHSETYLNDMENQGMHDFEQPPVVGFTDNEIHSDSNIIPYS